MTEVRRHDARYHIQDLGATMGHTGAPEEQHAALPLHTPPASDGSGMTAVECLSLSL